MPIKAVVFDFGGVLVRTENKTGRCKWEERLGLKSGELENAVFNSDVAIRSALGQEPEEAVWAHVAAQFRLDEQQCDELRRDFWRGDVLDQRLVSYMSSLRPRVLTAILSNAWSGARRLFVETFGLDKAVDVIIISAEENLAKPDPAIYDRLVTRLGVSPAETVFVDDFISNVEAAARAGIHAIHFRSTDETIAQVERLLESN